LWRGRSAVPWTSSPMRCSSVKPSSSVCKPVCMSVCLHQRFVHVSSMYELCMYSGVLCPMSYDLHVLHCVCLRVSPPNLTSTDALESMRERYRQGYPWCKGCVFAHPTWSLTCTHRAGRGVLQAGHRCTQLVPRAPPDTH
jgi:hypothetical protein